MMKDNDAKSEGQGEKKKKDRSHAHVRQKIVGDQLKQLRYDSASTAQYLRRKDLN